jgi:succinoglycan biosynthesis transport protein ExoP
METSLPVIAPSEVNLRDYLDVLRRRKAIMLETFVVVLAVGIVVTMLSKPVYETGSKILVMSSTPSVNLLTAENPLAAVLVQAMPDSVPTQIEDMQSTPFMEDVYRRAGRPRGGDTQDQSVRIGVVEGTNVIRVTVQSRDAKYAADLANAIVDLHKERSTKNSTEQIDKALEFISRQAAGAKAKLEVAERQLGRFRLENHIDRIQRDSEANVRAYLDLQGRDREAEFNLALARKQLEQLEIEDRTTPERVSAPTQRPNPRRARLEGKISEAEDRIEVLREQYTEQSPVLKDARTQLASLQQQLTQRGYEEFIEDQGTRANPLRDNLRQEITRVKTEIRGLEEQKRHIQREIPKYRPDPKGAGIWWEAQLTDLQRTRDNAQKVYDESAKQERDLAVRQQARRQTNRIIERAGVPGDPVRPKKATNILLSIALATCLGLAVAFLQEYLDDRVNSPEDADRAAHLPLLGHVPAIPEQEPTVVTNLPARSHVAEAYRTLRSSIGFAAVDGDVRTLMVTSPAKGEGKTVTSLNLAIAMALDGKQVLLVDADLRRPNIHKQLRLPQGPGLTDVLVGQQQPEQVLRPTEVAGLRVMTSGPIPPNPAELLNSQPMDRIIEQLRDMADIVVFDTAPCIPVSDSIVLSSKLDGVILVVHAGETKKAAVKHTRELLDRARARTLGIVFNRVPQRKGGYYYYYYYYYGGYYDDGPTDGGRRKGKRRGTTPGGSDPTAIVRADSDPGAREKRESGQDG